MSGRENRKRRETIDLFIVELLLSVAIPHIAEWIGAKCATVLATNSSPRVRQPFLSTAFTETST
jgi:hypothetical protein